MLGQEVDGTSVRDQADVLEDLGEKKALSAASTWSHAISMLQPIPATAPRAAAITGLSIE